MSEVLRELVVALSLDSDNFSRNLRTINQQIKEAESTFKLAGAGVANFEKSIQGTEARLALLSSKQKEQTRAVDQYSRALVQTNQKLTIPEALDTMVKWFCILFGGQFSPDDVYDHYPADRLMHDIALAIMAVQTQTTEVLDSFPTKPVAQEAQEILENQET